MHPQHQEYKKQQALYDIYLTKKANIVMLGDSITYFVDWNELLGINDIINRGIRSDNTFGVLARLDSIKKLNPELCFIMIGINHIAEKIPVNIVYGNYLLIINSLKENNIKPVIQSKPNYL